MLKIASDGELDISTVPANNELTSKLTEISVPFFFFFSTSADNCVSNKNHVCNKSYDVSSRNW